MIQRFLKVDQTFDWLMEEADVKTTQRGQSYYYSKRVGKIHSQNSVYTGVVQGTQLYHFTIDVNAENAECQCPAQYPCKHLVAAVYAISAKRNILIHDPMSKEIPNLTKFSGLVTYELVVSIDSQFKYRLMRRHPGTGQIQQVISSRESLALPNGKTIQPISMGHFSIFSSTYTYSEIEASGLLNDLPRYSSDGFIMKYCGEIPLKTRLVKAFKDDEYSLDSLSPFSVDNNDSFEYQNNVEDIDDTVNFRNHEKLKGLFDSIKSRDTETLVNQNREKSFHKEFNIEYYYIEPQRLDSAGNIIESREEVIINSTALMRNQENWVSFPVYRETYKPGKVANKSKKKDGLTFVKTVDHHEYYSIRAKHIGVLDFSLYQADFMNLSSEDLLIYQNKFSAFNVENLKSFLPKVFEYGPVVVLSIYPLVKKEEEDQKSNSRRKRLKIRGMWEFIYTNNKDVIENDENFAKAFAGKNQDKKFARFEIINKRRKVNKSFEYSKNGNYAQLNISFEHRRIDSLTDSSYYNGRKGGKLFSKKDIKSFITEDAEKLKNSGVKIQIHKSLTKLMSNDNSMTATFQIDSESSGIDWFDGQIESGGLNLSELRKALQAYRKKEEFIQLKDGNWVSLEMLGLKGLMKSFEKLGVKVNTDGHVKKMTRGEALSIAIELESETRTDAAVSDLKKRISHLPKKRAVQSGKFKTLIKGTLRDYQKEGILFLESLFEIGFGGILADDMGLGKTIQGLSFFSRLKTEKESKGKRMFALVVGPLASISVWQKESEKFFPDLKITLWHGAERTRSTFPNEGVLLTTYGTLLRDFESWKDKHHFDAAILDEAQNLKNFRSLSSHAVRQTSADVYFCLTGTPLENHLADLWALFDICFPGYLGTRKSFLKYYQDAPLDGLREKIEPFILRRRKSEVLKELPPLTETLVPVTMTEKQGKFYEQARKQAIIELAQAKENYLMVMLPHLTKLRRIACHPEAGNPSEAGIENSGKFQYLKNSIPELEETSQGILIFSQYTDILKICARLLEELGYKYFYLDGKTPLKKREAMVNKFQAGENSFFLISLKAGGTALTLHRADTVIHLDPWWNPATERQASDRAHRIGQKKKVFVYKLYSEKSIEEKVLELQKKKKEIFDALFGEGTQTTGKITRDQLLKLITE